MAIEIVTQRMETALDAMEARLLEYQRDHDPAQGGRAAAVPVELRRVRALRAEYLVLWERLKDIAQCIEAITDEDW